MYDEATNRIKARIRERLLARPSYEYSCSGGCGLTARFSRQWGSFICIECWWNENPSKRPIGVEPRRIVDEDPDEEMDVYYVPENWGDDETPAE